MNRMLIILSLILAVSGSAWIIRYQYSTINDLNIRIEEIQADRKAEIAHFERELDRQQMLKQLELNVEGFGQDAENDVSDNGSTFSASRLRRLSQIK